MREFLSKLSQLSRTGVSIGTSKKRIFKVRWVLPNQLAIGPCISSGAELILNQAGIQTVLTVCDQTEAPTPQAVQEQFHHVYYPLPDSHTSVPLKQQDLMTALNIVHTSLVHQRPIYVHCLAGMERSPTICIAYLCLFKGYGLWESFNWVKQVNPRTMPTEYQLDVVRSLIELHQDVPLFANHPHPKSGLVS